VLPGVYAIADSILLPSDDSLLTQVEAALQGGAVTIQYRDKSHDTPKRLRQAQALLNLCKAYKVPFIINDDVELALTINADGVHLGQQDLLLTQARLLLGPSKIIGITCHGSLELAQLAQQQGATYVAFGACFASPTKPEATCINLSLLEKAKTQLRIPLVAIGGITSENAQLVINTGADMIAVVSAIFADKDTLEKTKQLTQFFRT
jgi:thiamine-phosphate pyrophosphorylase